MLSNLDANIELINLAKSVSCLDDFTNQFNILVSSGCLTNVLHVTVDTIAKFCKGYNIYEKCMVISDKFNECYLMLIDSYGFSNIFRHILNKNVKQDLLHEIFVEFMYQCNHIYPTKFIDVIDLDKLYLMFIERSNFTISYSYDKIYLHFKNNKVDIDKYNDIIVDNIIRRGNIYKLVNLNIFNFTHEQLYKLNLYGRLNTRDILHQTMIDNKFCYDFVKHIFDNNPDYTPDILIYDDMRFPHGDNFDKIFELLKSRDCFPRYINIVKYVIEFRVDISLETLNIYDDDVHVGNRYLKSLIDNVVINPDDKMIYIPKYREHVVLPVKRYFDDESYVNINIFLASIIGHEYDRMKVKDFRDIVKHEYNKQTYIYYCDVDRYIDCVYFMKDYTYIKTDNFIDYVLDKYSP